MHYLSKNFIEGLNVSRAIVIYSRLLLLLLLICSREISCLCRLHTNDPVTYVINIPKSPHRMHRLIDAAYSYTERDGAAWSVLSTKLADGRAFRLHRRRESWMFTTRRSAVTLELHYFDLSWIRCGLCRKLVVDLLMSLLFSHEQILRIGPVWAWERCRISPPRFLAECCKRQLNQGSFVLLYFRLFTFLSPRKRGIMFLPALVCQSVCLSVCLFVCLFVTAITK